MKAHLKALSVVIVFLLIGFVCYYSFFRPQTGGEVVIEPTAQKESVVLPTKNLKLVEGTHLDFAKLKNKIVIMNFWASWCAPCIEEVPSLVELTKKNKDIVVLAISGDSKIEDLVAFMKSFPGFNQAPFFQVWDNNQEVLKNYNISKLPESFIFNRKGEMVKRVSGTLNWNTPDSLEFFKSLE